MSKLTEALQEEKEFLSCGRSYPVNMAYIRRIEDTRNRHAQWLQNPDPGTYPKNVVEQHWMNSSGWK